MKYLDIINELEKYPTLVLDERELTIMIRHLLTKTEKDE